MSKPADTPPDSLLALDFGLRRIGIASGLTVTAMATPVATIRAIDGEPDWPALDRIVAERQPDILVLGLPYNSDGSESAMTAHVQNFAAALKSRYGLGVELVDERYTSAEAEALLREERRTGLRNKKLKKEDVDSRAAALIAESWMRSQQFNS